MGVTHRCSIDIKTYLREKKERVDQFLHSYFSKKNRPHILHEAMTYSLFAGGKRIRPVLALASYEACGRNSDEIIAYASTLEYIHTYSLIHDDLPAMDNDDLRRGNPTNHKVYGEAMAILAGDALLTEAFSILSDPSHCPSVSDRNLLDALREVSTASGLQGMVAGQAQDILSEDTSPDEETLFFIHSHKTAALIRASVLLGPILSGAGQAEKDALTVYGEKVGLAFQVIDDILDIEGETEELGKTVGADQKTKKMTYPSLYGLEKSRKIAEGLISDAVASLKPFSSDADPLRGLAEYLLTRRS